MTPHDGVLTITSTLPLALLSAGMVLEWLLNSGRIQRSYMRELREQLVSYVDDVDNGRVAPTLGVPCFPSLVASYNLGCKSSEDFKQAFLRAGQNGGRLCERYCLWCGRNGHPGRRVRNAMLEAERLQRNYLLLEEYVKWKRPTLRWWRHPPHRICAASGYGWQLRAVAIPPELGSFAQKQPLPESWAGRDVELRLRPVFLALVFAIKSVYCGLGNQRATGPGVEAG